MRNCNAYCIIVTYLYYIQSPEISLVALGGSKLMGNGSYHNTLRNGGLPGCNVLFLQYLMMLQVILQSWTRHPRFLLWIF
jgi:hypothetical protein